MQQQFALIGCGKIAERHAENTVTIGGQYLNELKYQLIDDYVFEDAGTGNGVNDYKFYKGSMSNHQKVYENLLLALNDDSNLPTSAEG